MKIISRKQERKELERCDKSKKSELVCVYGRRRVGKTYLIEQTFGEYFAFRATAIENSNSRSLLKAFYQRLLAAGDKTKTIPKDWYEAFARLENILNSDDVKLSPYGKKIVFFDEFPWFATPRSEFLSAFEEFWNRRGTQYGDLVLIICGSATSWIIKNIINNTGSMYHRLTEKIFIKPFTLHETELFFKDREFDWSKEQIAECQMVFGGLPYFFDLMNESQSFRQNVNRLLLGENALLKDETNRLLEATLSKSPIYNEILQELSTYKYGVRKCDLQEKLKAADGTYARAIENLKECGYIIEYKKNYEKNNPLYLQLVDPFLIFHYHFLSLKTRLHSYEELVENEGKYNNWRGCAFETLCIQHVDDIKRALGISGVKTNCYTWNNLGSEDSAQIDLVIERADNIIDICEIKYTDAAFTMDKSYEEKLLHKRDVFKNVTKTKQALKIVMISAHGIKGKAYTEHISEIITLEDLFGE